jgi:hypothetical protein
MTICALMPIKSVTDALCRKETNHLNADTAIKFLLESLDSENSEIATALQMAL